MTGRRWQGVEALAATTILRALSGLCSIRCGRVRFMGESLVGLPPRKLVGRGSVHVPDGRQLWPRMKVEENLRVGGLRPFENHGGCRRGAARVAP